MKIIWRIENTRNFSILPNKDGSLRSRRTWYHADIPQEMYDKHTELIQELTKLEEEIQDWISNPPRV